MIEVRRNNQLVEDYGYDANGNRILHTSIELDIINQTASYTSGDQLQNRGNTSYSYDANGRLSSKLILEGDLGLTTYVYSSEGRLLQVDTPEQAISYRHNALGNRVAKLINGQVVEQYLWQDLTTLLAVYDGQGNLKQRFEYTLGHTPTSFTQNGQRYFIQADHLGSPRVITDSSGNIVKTVSYDSYGNIIEDSNSAFQIPFSFAGGLYDPDTKLIRFGYRDYDPETGRWTAKDPIGFAGGDTNLYGYVFSNPINWIDPEGLASCTYSIAAHTLVCVSSTANETLTLGPEGVHSGRGEHKNNPDSSGVKDYGPIWLGTFNMSPNDNREGWIALQDTNWNSMSALAYYLGSKRAGANLHVGTVSHGCITVNPQYQEQFDAMVDFLSRESESNILTAIP